MINSSKFVVFQTDKSKKHTIDSPDNYRENMEKYTKDYKIVDEKFVTLLTKKLNEVNKNLVSI